MKNKINSKLIQEEFENDYLFYKLPKKYLLLLSELSILDDMEDWPLYQEMMNKDIKHYDILEEKCIFENGQWILP